MGSADRALVTFLNWDSTTEYYTTGFSVAHCSYHTISFIQFAELHERISDSSSALNCTYHYAFYMSKK